MSPLKVVLHTAQCCNHQLFACPNDNIFLTFVPSQGWFFLFNTIFVLSQMYPENSEGTQVIVGSTNMGYISDTARNQTHNLFRPKCEPIPLVTDFTACNSCIDYLILVLVYFEFVFHYQLGSMAEWRRFLKDKHSTMNVKTYTNILNLSEIIWWKLFQGFLNILLDMAYSRIVLECKMFKSFKMTKWFPLRIKFWKQWEDWDQLLKTCSILILETKF